MSTSRSRITSALTSLMETCEDDREGFLTAAENVKNAELKLLFSEIAMQRLQFAKELRGLAQGFGGKTGTGGTLAGAFHRAWMQLKAAITGGDEHAICSVEIIGRKAHAKARRRKEAGFSLRLRAFA